MLHDNVIVYHSLLDYIIHYDGYILLYYVVSYYFVLHCITLQYTLLYHIIL